jgi:hypothetical protein
MNPPMTQTEIQILAAAYADAIKDAVTTDEWNEIVRRNETEHNGAFDATHDFVDANHYILAAYEHMTGKEPSMDERNMIELTSAVDYALKTFFKKV